MNTLNIDKKYYPKIANVFSRSTLNDFIRSNSTISNIIQCGEVKQKNKDIFTYRDFFESSYNLIEREYQNEYIYKNKLAIKELLLDTHNDNATILNEINTLSSKIDMLVLNGTITAYEIKTELDTTNRLEKQLLNYTLVFDKVNIFTHITQLKNIRSIIKGYKQFKNVGICILQNGEIEFVKEPKSSIRHLDKDLMFGVLRQSEAKKIFSSNDLLVCKERFRKLSKNKAHEVLLNALLHREKTDRDFIDSLPNCLKFSGIKLNSFNKKEKNSFTNKLICDIVT